MIKKNTFSKRNGYRTINEKEITVREDAPKELRENIKMTYYGLDKKPSDLRSITSGVLKKSPDSNNWSEYPNIDYEVEQHLKDCDWYLVYDIIEAIIKKLNSTEKIKFSEEINEYFIENGIGWKIVNGLVETRGDEVFEKVVKTVASTLEEAKFHTAKKK